MNSHGLSYSFSDLCQVTYLKLHDWRGILSPFEEEIYSTALRSRAFPKGTQSHLLGWCGLRKYVILWGELETETSVQFSRSVVSDSLRPHESQHARPPSPSPTPGVHPDSCPSSQWCHPAISSSVVPFSSCHHPPVAYIWSKANFPFHQSGLFIGFWAVSSQTLPFRNKSMVWKSYCLTFFSIKNGRICSIFNFLKNSWCFLCNNKV